MTTLSKNRKAHRDFEILEDFEAGIVLTGTEVKSCRMRNLSLDDGYAVVKEGQLWLHGVHIAPYTHGNIMNHEPRRVRKLLVHKKEIRRLRQYTQEKSYTIVPLRCFLKGGLIKLQMGLCRGKKKKDKREDMKRKIAEDEARQAIGR